MLVLGLDGATLDLVRPWAEAGHLPNLRRLMAEGAWGRLQSTLPPVTAPAWASFMTGKHPSGHGVFDFFRGRAGGFDLIDADDIAGPTLWRLLSQGGVSAGVLNVPITHPPETIAGFIVPGLLSPDQGATTHPPGLLEPYRSELGPYRLTPRHVYRPGHEAAFIADLHEILAVQLGYALRLAADHPTDLLMVHFLVTDIAQHALWRHLDPTHPWHEPQLGARFGQAVRDLFAAVDEGLGRLLGLLPSDARVIILSDHGFGPVHRLVNLNLFLLERGLLALKPQARRRYRLLCNRLLGPMAWRLGRLRGRAKLLDFADVDWARTRAYAMGHMGQVFINRRRRQPADPVAAEDFDRERQAVAAALLELRHPDDGEPLVAEVVAGGGDGPDLHVIFRDGATAYPLFVSGGRLVDEQQHGNSGDHRRQGLVILAGPGIRRGVEIENAAIVDLAPTILHCFGLSIPAEMDGRVLVQALAQPETAAARPMPPTPPTERRDPRLSSSEQAILLRQLRSLGYLA
jgi:predicted AlkP superfamily phosphohydrolase/phosphomutase